MQKALILICCAISLVSAMRLSREQMYAPYLPDDVTPSHDNEFIPYQAAYNSYESLSTQSQEPRREHVTFAPTFTTYEDIVGKPFYSETDDDQSAYDDGEKLLNGQEQAESISGNLQEEAEEEDSRAVNDEASDSAYKYKYNQKNRRVIFTIPVERLDAIRAQKLKQQALIRQHRADMLHYSSIKYKN